MDQMAGTVGIEPTTSGLKGKSALIYLINFHLPPIIASMARAADQPSVPLQSRPDAHKSPPRRRPSRTDAALTASFPPLSARVA
jgi:hypothetical protein